MAVTIRKIAEICGVSRGTVDRVLNNRGRVSQENIDKVNRAIQELGYKPNTLGKTLAEAALRYVQKWKADMLLCVTVGKAGAYCGQGEKLEFVMPYPAETVNTTGAGDAFFGAMLSGLALGLPFFGNENEGQKRCHSAPQLAAVCAGLAVESPDSIPEEITKAYILGKLEEKGYVVAEEIKKRFMD